MSCETSASACRTSPKHTHRHRRRTNDCAPSRLPTAWARRRLLVAEWELSVVGGTIFNRVEGAGRGVLRQPPLEPGLFVPCVDALRGRVAVFPALRVEAVVEGLPVISRREPLALFARRHLRLNALIHVPSSRRKSRYAEEIPSPFTSATGTSPFALAALAPFSRSSLTFFAGASCSFLRSARALTSVARHFRAVAFRNFFSSSTTSSSSPGTPRGQLSTHPVRAGDPPLECPALELFELVQSLEVEQKRRGHQWVLGG